MESLVQQNIHQLAMLREFLNDIQKQDYQQKLPLLFGSSIGMHVRHIVEFYDCFLEVVGSADFINYDLRRRGANLENDLGFAIVKISSLIGSLAGIDPVSGGITVVTGSATGEKEMHKSSTKRELLYLAEHTTHHMATIRMAAAQTWPNVDFPSDFGLAQSTINANLSR